MESIIGEASAPGVVTLFGGYGSILGEPAVSLATDLRVTLKVQPAEYDFYVIDGYKLDPKRHSYFKVALDRFWQGQSLEFDTLSQVPMQSGCFTRTALITVLTGTLLNLSGSLDTGTIKKKLKKKGGPPVKKVEDKAQDGLKTKKSQKGPNSKKTPKAPENIDIMIPPNIGEIMDGPSESQESYGKFFKKLGRISRITFILESAIEPPVSSISTSTSAAGGTVLMDNISKGSLWSVPDLDRKWHVHKFPALEGVELVIGHPKQIDDHSMKQPKPLYGAQLRTSRRRRSRASKITDKVHGDDLYQESILKKLQRMVLRTGFAKDIIRDIGKVTRTGIAELSTGNLSTIGQLMSKEYNLLLMLGVCPEPLKPLVEVAKRVSHGVTLTGLNGEALLAISNDPKLVVEKIQNAGGSAIITKVSEQGFKMNIELKE